MNNLFLQLSAKALSMLCLFLGTMSEVIAQYGAPSYYFRVNGSVRDIECDAPVPNANVVLIDRESNQEYKAQTDSLGNFTFVEETYHRSAQYILNVNDADGDANGRFKDAAQNALVEPDWSYIAQSDSVRQIVRVTFLSGSPCHVKDSLSTPQIDLKPLIKSIITKPQEAIIDPELDTTEPENNENPLVPDPSILNSLLLYPNPNEGEFAIRFNLTQEGVVNVSINSINGALIYSESFFAEAGEVLKQFGIAKPAPGTYIMHLNTNNAAVSKPFIVE